MNKKDILELKRRFKKDACTFTRLCGCYVDADRNKVTTFGETFLNLEDEEFYKYLEIAKKGYVRHDRQQHSGTGISDRRGGTRRKTAVFDGAARERLKK